jgi:hypothetical protein
MFQMAVLLGLKSYLSSCLERDPGLASLADGKQPPSLELALQPEDPALSLELGSVAPQLDSEITSVLLNYGAEPDQVWKSRSVWHRFLRRIHNKTVFAADDAELTTIIRELLNAGADFTTEVVVGAKTQGGGIGAGREYQVKESPKAILAKCCSPDDVYFLSQQYSHPGVFQRLLHGIGWV